MNNLKQKHKDYLIKNEIKDLTDLVNYVEILRNTSNLQGEDRQMLFDFAFLITNEQLSLKSFFAETKSLQNKNPSREFYNVFKKFAENEDKNPPTFMDEVLGESNYDSAFNGGFTSLKKEDWKVLEDSKTETATEVPNFMPKFGHLPRTVKIITYYSPAVCRDMYRTVELKQDSKKDEKQGEKETEGKLNYELDWEFIQQLAERMSQNKGKYKPYNWMQPIDVEKLKQSLFRHVVEVMKGNYEDDGRTFGHLESISANVMMINYQLKNSVK